MGDAKHILSLASVEAAAVHIGIDVPLMKRAARRGEVPGAELNHGDWLFDLQKLKAWWKGLLAESQAMAEEAQRKEAQAKADKLAKTLVPRDAILAAAQPWAKSGSGIYFLIHNGVVVYVGQARHVMARLAQHSATKTFDAWHWVPCPPRRLNEIERAYINALRPALNRDPITCKLRTSWEAEAEGDG